jgi:putative transposase
MLQLNLNLPELKEFAKGIPTLKEGLFSLMRLDVKEMATNFVNSVLDAELEIFLGRSKYERKTAITQTKRNYRNGFYLRTMAIKGIGKVSIKIPRDRKGDFQNNILPRYQRIENAIKEDVALLYLTGLSTRTMHLLSKRLFGVSLSPTEVSLCSAKLSDAVEKWRNRDIVDNFKYLYLDGTNFPMRIEKTIQKVNVLVVIGVTESGHKQVLALQAGDRVSTQLERNFVDLKRGA